MSETPNGSKTSHRSEIVAILSAASGPWAVVALVAILLMVGACTLDSDKLAQERENLRTLCEDPITVVGKRLCRVYVEERTEEPLSLY